MKTVGSIFHSPKRNHERRGSNNYNQHQHRHSSNHWYGYSYSSPRKYFSRKFRSKLSWHEVRFIYTTICTIVIAVLLLLLLLFVVIC